MFKSKRELVFIVLAGLFITNAVVAELIGSKLIQIGPVFGMGPFIMSIGIIPWPVVFLTTDLINEYYGRSGVRKLSLITASLIAYAFIVLLFAINVPAAVGISTVTDDQFFAVFGQSLWIIVASIIAFLISQLVDVYIFWLLRDKTGGKMIWLRSTGSTIISQLIDTFVVLGIAFWLPGKMTTAVFLNAALTGYTFKLIIAVVLTPMIYVGHRAIEKYLGDEASHEVIKKVAEESLHHKVEE
ncbi:MAG: putative queuosine precursor transporter [Bacteroidetes bacterium]|nr:putative queuosine precursor transporter [Bacteroidota bacterium]